MRIKFDEKQIKWGITAFLVILCSIIVFFVIYRFNDVHNVAGVCTSILMPFIIGLVMAYLLCPIYNFVVRGTYALFQRGGRRFSRALTVSKGIGTLVAVAALLVVVAGILWMIIPGLVESVIKIIDVLPASMESLKEWLDVKLVNVPAAKDMVDSWINNFTDNAIKFVTETVLPEYSSIATRISEGVIGVLNIVKNFFIAIIICMYFLNSKDTFAAQIKSLSWPPARKARLMRF